MRPTNYSVTQNLTFFYVNSPSSLDRVPDLPEDITELDGPGLMELFRGMTSWCEFADQILAEAKAMEDAAEKVMARQLALTATMSDKKLTVTAQRQAALLDDDVKAAEDKLRYAYANRLRAEAAVKMTDRRHAVISRELTRRSSTIRGRSM